MGYRTVFLWFRTLNMRGRWQKQRRPPPQFKFRFGFCVIRFSGGFTLSTSAITSLNGGGICGIGWEPLPFAREVFKSPAVLLHHADDWDRPGWTTLWGGIQSSSPETLAKYSSTICFLRDSR
jgi:hypothetical protein